MEKNGTEYLSNIIRMDDERIQDQLGKIVRRSVEDALNALSVGAERLAGTGRCQGTEARRDIGSGSNERMPQTRAGEVRLKVAKLRRQTFQTATNEHYRRRKASVEEAVMEVYLAGVPMLRVENVTDALWGTPRQVGIFERPNANLLQH